MSHLVGRTLNVGDHDFRIFGVDTDYKNVPCSKVSAVKQEELKNFTNTDTPKVSLPLKRNNEPFSKYRSEKYDLVEDVDNTSDLTSSPPPPISTSSCCSSASCSPSSSSLNPLQNFPSILPEFKEYVKVNISQERVHSPSLESSSAPHQSKLFLESQLSETYKEVSLSKFDSCKEGCPNSVAVQCKLLCTKCPFSPIYPPTVSSIREAVSHLTRLDDFNVVKLSQGFFSQVFKVTHFSSKKVMVLKMNKEAGNRANALREIELLNKLNHKNIVGYMGTVVHEGALHPLLEYINGGNLEQLIQPFYSLNEDLSSETSTTNIDNCDHVSTGTKCDRPWSFPPKIHRLRNPDWTFMKLMQDVARGMDYLHSMGYLHRDLASKNIFIRKMITTNCDTSSTSRLSNQASLNSVYKGMMVDDFDDEKMIAVIGDFGFATTHPKKNQKLSTVGSPYWLAPECFKNLWYNHKCDIYSFGVICCELNWRIPSDPDFLPRCSDNFVVDFSKLTTKNDSTLAKLARSACQIEPTSRPEFSSILETLDLEINEESLEKLFHYGKDYSKNTEVKPIDFIEPDYLRSSQGLQCIPETFARDCRLDSNADSSRIPLLPDHNFNVENDIFEQHLLRRRYSFAHTNTAASKWQKSDDFKSSILPNINVAQSNAHPQCYHRKTHRFLRQNFSCPLPSPSHDSQ